MSKKSSLAAARRSARRELTRSHYSSGQDPGVGEHYRLVLNAVEYRMLSDHPGAMVIPLPRTGMGDWSAEDAACGPHPPHLDASSIRERVPITLQFTGVSRLWGLLPMRPQ
jgi:hypothetical protein